MGAWLFQGNPDTFDVDGYFAAKDTVTWAVRQEGLAPEMREGDRVFFWRAAGRERRPSGVVSAGRLLGVPERRADDPESFKYWRNPADAVATRLRVPVALERSARSRLLPKERVLADSVLSELRILKMRNETNYRLSPEEAELLEELWQDAPAEPPTAWLLITLDDEERQHGGNVGYADEAESLYLFDSMVPNSRQVREGDLAVLRSDRLLGVARMKRLEGASGTKELRRCPKCNKTSLKLRKTLTPRYRCAACKATFEKPRLEVASVTKYAAHFDGSFVSTPAAVPLEDLRAACPKYNGQHAMQRIDLASLLPRLESANPEVGALLMASSQGRPSPVDEVAFSEVAVRVEGEGCFDPSDVQDARDKAMRAIVQRRGQPKFREKLLTAYAGECAITGCTAKETLEAAHIIRYQGEQTNHVQNGILLRSDIHTLFDSDLIAIDTKRWRIVLHPRLRGGPYAPIHGRRVRLPRDPSARPNASALESRRRKAGLVSDTDYALDTNVFADIFGLEVSTNTDPYRWRRAHHALSMVLAFDKGASRTWVLSEEPMRVLSTRYKDDNSMIHGYHFVHFVMDVLLPHWRIVTTVAIDSEVQGNSADRLLVESARRLDVPLISNETNPKGTIRKTAAALDVDVVTTEEFCALHPLESSDWNSFFVAFDERTAKYCADRFARAPEQLRGFREWLAYFGGRPDHLMESMGEST